MADEKNDELLHSVDFQYNGTTYTMEFNRRTVEYVEKRLNVKIQDLISGNVGITYLPDLFKASLIMHHPRMKAETADMLYSMMDDKLDLFTAIVEMIAGTVNVMFEEPEEGKAISWTRH